MSNPEPHPVSSPSKAVDVLSVLRARCKADAVNDDFNMLAATAAVEKLIAAADRAAFRLEAMARTLGSPRFTDRHGDGPACAERATELRAALEAVNGR